MLGLDLFCTLNIDIQEADLDSNFSYFSFVDDLLDMSWISSVILSMDEAMLEETVVFDKLHRRVNTFIRG